MRADMRVDLSAVWKVGAKVASSVAASVALRAGSKVAGWGLSRAAPWARWGSWTAVLWVVSTAVSKAGR
jgi:hypothetical protein